MYELASTHIGVVMGVLGKKAKVGRTFEEILLTGIDDFYALMIVGGPGTQIHLWNNRYLIDLIKIFNIKGKVVAGIDNAPIVIAKTGILRKKPATVASGQMIREMMKEDVVYQNKPVVFKDRIVTASSHEASSEFAEIIIRYEKEDPEFVPTTGKAGFEF